METNFLIYFTLYCLIGVIFLAYTFFDKTVTVAFKFRTIHLIPLIITFIVFWPLALVKSPTIPDTRKKCPYCGYTGLINISSQNIKLCTNSKCNKQISWPLDPGQKKVL